jgi:hypothetical protein
LPWTLNAIFIYSASPTNFLKVEPCHLTLDHKFIASEVESRLGKFLREKIAPTAVSVTKNRTEQYGIERYLRDFDAVIPITGGQLAITPDRRARMVKYETPARTIE